MKGIFVILDGVADESCQVLEQRTPLDAAKTPNLDYFAEHGKLDYCFTVRKDYVPESNEGILSLLGYNSVGISRGWLEALGLGIQLKSGDLVLRCNFATVDNLHDRNVLDRRAGRTLTTKEAKILAYAINKNVKLPFRFEFYPAIQHRGVLVIRGGFSDNISGIDVKNGKLAFSEPLDEDDDSKLSADLLNQFVRKCFEVLDRHPINLARARKGLFSANLLLCRGAGSEKVRLKKIKGKWMAFCYMPLEIGIARAVGMDVYRFRYPKLRGMDVYSNLYAGLKKAIRNAIKMLKRNRNKYDYFLVHLKETDIPGHDNKPIDKVRMIELIDNKLFYFLRGFIKNEKLIVTADHVTACRKKAHTSGAVPVLTYPIMKGNPRGKVEKRRFIESDGLNGKQILGRKLFEERLFVK